MNFKQTAPYFLGVLMLTFGAAGIVTAYSGLPQLRTQVVSFQEQGVPVPLTEEKKDSSANNPVPTPPVTALELPNLGQQQLQNNLPTQMPVTGNLWDQADGDANPDNRIDRLHVIFLDGANEVSGRISTLGGGLTLAAEGLPPTVNFLRDHAIVQSVPLGPDGSFRVSGLSRGAYGVGVVTPTTILAYSVYVGSIEDLTAAGYSQNQIAVLLDRQKSVPLQIDSVSTSPSDYAVVRDMLVQTTMQGVTQRTSIQSGQLSVPTGIDFATAEAGTTLRNHTIYLQPDQSLVGRVRKPLSLPSGMIGIEPIPGTELSFIQNNQLVASAVTIADGSFTLNGVAPGNYSVIARSIEGVAALGIQVLPAPGQNDLAASLTLDVTLTEDLGLLFVEVLTEEELELLEEECCGIEPGVAGGFMGGGGAAGGGGLGLFPFLLGGLLGSFLNDGGDCGGGGCCGKDCDPQQSPYAVY